MLHTFEQRRMIVNIMVHGFSEVNQLYNTMIITNVRRIWSCISIWLLNFLPQFDNRLRIITLLNLEIQNVWVCDASVTSDREVRIFNYNHSTVDNLWPLAYLQLNYYMFDLFIILQVCQSPCKFIDLEPPLRFFQ